MSNSNREYIEHTYSGTTSTSHTHTWTFNWTSPSTYSGGTTFYVAINSTNNDGTSSGDHIFAKTFSASVLPVKFLSFDAVAKNNLVQLKWETATEINSSNFVIEKSADAKNWNAIGTVNAAGNSSNNQQYSYTDEEQVSSYYKLKQVDLDGKFDYSKIVYATINSVKNTMNIYPMPANNSINISSDKFKNTNNTVSVKIIDLKGKIVGERTFDKNESLNLDVNAIAKGIYILQLTNGVDIEMKKFVIER